MRKIAACLLAVSSLSGCNNSEPTTNPTPSPTPTPAPTPTPTPATIAFSPLNVDSFDFSGDWIRHRYQITGNLRPNVNLGDLETGTDAKVTLSSGGGYNKFSVGSYLDDTIEATKFESASSAGGRDDVVIYAWPSSGRIGILNNSKDGWLSADPFYRFTYMSTVQAKAEISGDGVTALTDDIHIVVGQRTGAVPNATRSYTTRVRGTVWNKDDPYGTTNYFLDVEMDAMATAVFDPSASASERLRVNFSMPLKLYGESNRAQIAGVGSVDAEGFIQGTLTSSDSDFTGKFFGRFYGPNGAELGLVIGLTDDIGTPARASAMLLGR